jgi:anti-sigma regulatory factor (Ser/Thr protein kinase)
MTDAPILRQFRCDVSCLRAFREFIATSLRSMQAGDGDDHTLIVLAAHETAANLIRHAAIPDGKFRVALGFERESLFAVVFRYRGVRFDVQGVPSPAFDGSRESGFGLHVIRECVHDVTYAQDERGEMRITLRRRVAPHHLPRRLQAR